MSIEFRMSLLLLFVLFIGGDLPLCLDLSAGIEERSRRHTIAAVLLFLPALMTAGVIFVLYLTGVTLQYAISAAQLLMIGAACVYFLYGLFTRRPRTGAGITALMLVYLLILLYFTLLSRSDREQTTVFMSLHSFENFAKTHHSDELTHFLLNIVLFMPFGFLLPMVQPDQRGRLLSVVLIGAFCSAAIESLQLIYRLGQSDIEDLLANTLGTAAGCGLYALLGKRLMHS